MDDKTFSLAKEFLEYSSYNLASVALACGYKSQKKLSKDFKAVAEMSPFEYYNKFLLQRKVEIDEMNRVRAEEKKAELMWKKAEDKKRDAEVKRLMKVSVISPAQKMLEQTDMSVQKIADELGINRIKMFRYFKSVLGVSPGEYRKNIRIAHMLNTLVADRVKPKDLPFQI